MNIYPTFLIKIVDKEGKEVERKYTTKRNAVFYYATRRGFNKIGVDLQVRYSSKYTNRGICYNLADFKQALYAFTEKDLIKEFCPM